MIRYLAGFALVAGALAGAWAWFRPRTRVAPRHVSVGGPGEAPEGASAPEHENAPTDTGEP